MARGTIQYAASGKFASTGVDDNGDATTLTIDVNENLGIGGVNPASFLFLPLLSL